MEFLMYKIIDKTIESNRCDILKFLIDNKVPMKINNLNDLYDLDYDNLFQIIEFLKSELNQLIWNEATSSKKWTNDVVESEFTQNLKTIVSSLEKFYNLKKRRLPV